MADSNTPNLIARMAAKARGNPRKPNNSGSTLQSSKTALLPPPTPDQEFGSSQPVILREIVPELSTAQQRLAVYTKMMNDAGVDVSIRAAKTPVLGADFFVDPYSNDPQDVLIADFISANLFGGMNSPFLNSLEDILRMYEDGYTVFEKVHEYREWTSKGKGSNTKTYTMLKKLGIRPASTIVKFENDNNGGPLNIVHNAIQADGSVKEVKLDISKVIIFTFGKNAGDLTGKSLLRTAYSHWYYKTHFYKIDAVQKERHSLGVPRGKLQAGYTPADKLALRTLLKNLRSNEEAFMILPPNIEVDFAEIKSGQLVNVLESADHHNSMILMNVLAQFLALGLNTSGGGRATAGAQTDIFMKSLKYVARLIADIINMYVIPELVVWNFPTKNYPQLKVRNIGDTRDLQMLGSALANLVHEGVIVMDDPTEEWARETFDMPGKSQDTTGAPRPIPAAASTNGGQQNQSKRGAGTSRGVTPTAPQ